MQRKETFWCGRVGATHFDVINNCSTSAKYIINSTDMHCSAHIHWQGGAGVERGGHDIKVTRDNWH